MNIKNTAQKIGCFFKQDTDEVLEKMFLDEKKKKQWLMILVTAIVVSLADYLLLMINGYGGPDTVAEGCFFYYGDVNAFSLYRWAIPYINYGIMRKLVAAHMIVILYALIIAVAVCLLCSMFSFEKKTDVILLTAAMVSFPVVTRQYAYIYMALAYAVAFLMVVLAAYLFRKRKWWSIAVGIFALIVMMGCYQAYVAAAATVVFMLFIMDMVNEKKAGTALLDMGIYIGNGIVAVLVNHYVAELLAKFNGVAIAGRVDSFSVSEIFRWLKDTIGYCYLWFFNYYNEKILGRSKLYLILLMLILVGMVFQIVRLVKNGKIVNAVLLAVGVLLMPVAINLCAILFPHNGISSVMKYQYVMIIPIAFFFADRMPAKSIASNCLRWIVLLDVFALVFGYSITAVSTELGYKIAYDATEAKAELILSDVFKTEGYEFGKTKVILGGAIDWSGAYMENRQIFLLGEVEAGPVFWSGSPGMTICRERYFKNYLGVDVGSISQAEYLEAVKSEKYAAMPLWPAEGSVDWYNDALIVKLTENPVLY